MFYIVAPITFAFETRMLTGNLRVSGSGIRYLNFPEAALHAFVWIGMVGVAWFKLALLTSILDGGWAGSAGVLLGSERSVSLLQLVAAINSLLVLHVSISLFWRPGRRIGGRRPLELLGLISALALLLFFQAALCMPG